MCECDGTGGGSGYGYGYGLGQFTEVGTAVGKTVFGGLKSLFGGGLAPQVSTAASPCPGTPPDLIEPLARLLATDPAQRATLRATLASYKHMNKPVATMADTDDPRQLATVAVWWAWGGYDCEVGNFERTLQSTVQSLAARGRTIQAPPVDQYGTPEYPEGRLPPTPPPLDLAGLPGWLVPLGIATLAFAVMRR